MIWDVPGGPIRLHTPNAGGLGSIPGQIPHAEANTRCSQTNK